MKKPKVAGVLKESFEGLTRYPLLASQPCVASWSQVQGLGANYRNRPVVHELVPDDCKPVLPWNGPRRVFPEPTTTLKELRTRRSKGVALRRCV